MHHIKGDLLCSFLQADVPRVCMWSFSLKYQTDIFYSLLKLPLLGYEPKRTDFDCFALMQISCCYRRRGRSFKSSAPASVANLATLSLYLVTFFSHKATSNKSSDFLEKL